MSFCFFPDFKLLVLHIRLQPFTLEKVKVCNHEKENTSTYFSEVIENNLVVIDEKYSKKVNRKSPENGSHHIVGPKVLFAHTT